MHVLKSESVLIYYRFANILTVLNIFYNKINTSNKWTQIIINPCKYNVSNNYQYTLQQIKNKVYFLQSIIYDYRNPPVSVALSSSLQWQTLGGPVK
jgi:hypothetical protein